MALTNFTLLTTEQKTVWSTEIWKMARNASFINQFAGAGMNSMVQRITELRKDEKGARAVLTLVPDLEGDGVVGDYDLEDNEEQAKAYDKVIRMDQLRNANRLAGRMADQKSVVNFREQSRDLLAYWLADRIDQLAFLTLSGVAYTQKNTGEARPVLAAGQNLGDLEFAADVSAPSSDRQMRWDSASGDWVPGDDTASIVAADTVSYKSLVKARAEVKNRYMRGIRASGNQEVFHVFVNPTAMATLKLDPDYLNNVRYAMPRSRGNDLFAGTSSVMVDGLVIHEFRHVYSTTGLASGSKWGAAGDVDGVRVLMCGAQALGMADIGIPYWEEKTFDYGNQHGISIGKIFGLLKPKFHSIYSGSAQDFGVAVLDYAL